MEHLTKEEIINKYWDDPTNLLDAVPKIMDEYAKQLAIGFAEWCVNNHSVDYEGFSFPVWINHQEYGAEQLYELYLLSINKK